MPETDRFAAFTWDGLARSGSTGAPHYHEFLRVPALSAGRYHLPAGSTDPQQPHREDEVYYVVRGRSRFVAGDETIEVGPGAVLYVPKELPHRFVDIREDLEILVLFAPAETRGPSDAC